MFFSLIPEEAGQIVQSARSDRWGADILFLEDEAACDFDAAKATVRALISSPARDHVAATTFGADVTGAQVAAILQSFDQIGWPRLRLAELGPAQGAYIKLTETIYVSLSFVYGAGSAAVQNVLIHEIGHAIDHRLTGPETPGDEGAIFAALVCGATLTPEALTALRRADDEGMLVIDGQQLQAEFASTYGAITVDGLFTDWTASQRIDTAADAVAGYALYGTVAASTYLIGIESTSAAGLVIGAGTTIWLNTDLNRATGYNYPWGFNNVGAEYNVTFDSTGTPYLYTGAAGQTLVSATPLTYALSADGRSLEIALPSSLITPVGGTAPTSITLAAVIDNSAYLPGDYSTAVPEYTIKDPAAFPPPTFGSITIDGSFADWTKAEEIDTAANAVPGYALLGTVAAGTYVIGIESTSAADLAIGPGTTLWLNTDLNRATGYNLAWGFTNVGAEYNVTFDSTGTPYLYTGAAGQTLVSATPLTYALSADGKSLEIAVPQSLLTPAGGTAPSSIDVAGVIDASVYLPGDYSTSVPEYLIKALQPPSTYGSITIDGSFADWTAAAEIDTAANAVTGYKVFGTEAANTWLIGIEGTSATDPVIGPGTTIWLNTDQNRTTGYNLAWGFTNVGAEYNITFDATGTPFLYTGAAGQTLVSATPLIYARSADGESLEIAIPKSLLTAAGAVPATTIDVAAVINNAVYLPGDYSTVVPEYAVSAPPATYGAITVDGNFTDWTAVQRIDQMPGDTVTGYSIYGTAAAGNWLIGIQGTASTDATIGVGTTIWLDTDLTRATGYNLPWGVNNVGAEYNVTFDSTGTPYLYSGAAGQTLVSATPLTYGLSADGKSLELAIPEALLAPVGGTAPTTIDIAAEIAAAGSPSSITYLPGDFSNIAQYPITDPATLPPKIEQHKVAIVYSDTTAALYFSPSAYSDLFMAAQNQARMAGVSFDIIDESKLTNISNLVGYDALIFPDMADVNTAQLPAIMSALTNAVYHYGISIITSGDFLTNDQTGAALPGNPYANMQALLNVQRIGGANTAASITVTATDTSNPILAGYTPGQAIQTYTNEGYTDYEGVTAPADVLVSQTVSGVTNPLPAVVETKTGGTNVVFSSADLLGDGNLLSHVIQSVVTGTQAGLVLHTSRQAGIVATRMDMDQSQYPSDVSPVSNTGAAQPGIYDKLVPILAQWKAQYDFVGSYYINIGNTPTAADPTGTNWATALPYYRAIEALGGEIGNHSYTHLVNPPVTTITETTVGDTPAGSTTITLSGLPNFAGTTLGLIVGGSAALGANVTLPGVAGEAGAIANTTVTAISGNTISVGFQPGGYGTANDGTLADIPAGTTLTFSIPSENTNFLQTTGTILSAAGAPFTYDYEFNQSKLLEASQLGNTIDGAAVPGAPETLATSQNILQYYPSTSTYTGYVTGGYTGVGAGYPSAFGYMSPASESSVYIAPNMTFDFTEIQYEGRTIAQAEADWDSQLSSLAANAAGTPIMVWPIHDYGASAWDTSDSGATSPYTTQMYTDLIAQASADNYEFVTLEGLAARIAAQQKASVNYTTTGNTIAATVTPDPTAPDLGVMALSVVNGGTQVIQNAGSWYAYNAQELFVPRNGGSFTVNLGTTQDDLTHIANLPSRADLLSVTGDGSNLAFSMTGDGNVVVNLKTPTLSFVSIQGAPSASLTGNQLTLGFADTLVGPIYAPIQHDVAVEDSAAEFATALNDIVFGTAGNDTFRPAGDGKDTYYGDGGTDTMVFSGPQVDYQVTLGASGSPTVVTDLRAGSPDGTATLYNIANLVFASAPPAVTGIVASGTGITIGTGIVGLASVVTLTVSFSTAVTVAGGSGLTLTLNDGGTGTYSSGSGTTSLTFAYTTASGQTTSGLAVTSINLPTGTTIQDSTGLAATLTPVPTLSGTVQVITTPPTVTSIITSGTGITGGTGAVGVGAVISFTETFSSAVTVAGGTPTLTLSDGGTATYTGGSGTTALTFTNTVAAGQSSTDLAVSAEALNGATIVDVAGNAAILTGAVVNPAGTLQVITTPPTVTSITTSGTGITGGTGAVGVGAVISFTETFSSAVTVAGGTPTLTLSDGGTAAYTGGSGTTALTFTNTVAAGQSSTDLAVSAEALNGATIVDVAGNPAILTGAVVNPAGTLQVITTPPTVTSITTSGTGITGGAGDLNAGKTVTLTVSTTAAVTVAGGTPSLALNDGGVASYASGSGTSTLTFTYTVAAAQNTTDLIVNALALNGATIKDVAGNSLVAPASAINPAGTLIIDTTAPTVTVATVAGSGTVTANTAASGFTITGKTGGTGGVENGQIVTVQLLTAAKAVAATVTAAVSSNAWSATVTKAQATALSDGSYTAVATVSDKAGNAATSPALAFTVSEGPRVPTLALTSTALHVNAGASISLGITASSVSTADLVSVTIKGVPTYESITAPTGYSVSSTTNGTTKTYTIKEAAAGTQLTGLVLKSSYTGTGQPVANFTVMATSTEGVKTAVSASQTLAVTDPPVAGATATAASSDTLANLAQLLHAEYDAARLLVPWIVPATAGANSGGAVTQPSPSWAGGIPSLIDVSQISQIILPT